MKPDEEDIHVLMERCNFYNDGELIFCIEDLHERGLVEAQVSLNNEIASFRVTIEGYRYLETLPR